MRVIDEYVYTDEANRTLYKVTRCEGKLFFQQRKTDAGWDNSLGDVRRVLYRLPEVLNAVKRGETVFICEGEKDVKNLDAIGVQATTAPGGAAAKWLKGYSKALEGARVVLLPDNDEPGEKHMAKVAKALYGHCSSLKILQLPDLPPKGDVSDWIQKGHSAAELLQMVDAASEFVPETQESEQEVHGVSKQESPAIAAPLTDLGNAELFVRRHGNDLRFCHDQQCWYFWNGRLWESDGSGEVLRRAKVTAAEIFEASGAIDPKANDEVAKWGRKSASLSRIRAMVALAQSDPLVAISAEAFDRDDFLFNTLSGTLDLRTGKIREHCKADLITLLAPVHWDPDATSEVFDKFLKTVIPDEDLRGFVQRSLGYTLTGSTAEEVFYFLYGCPQSGKTTLLEAVSKVFGDYSCAASYKTFAKNNSTGNSANCDVARLVAKRLVKVSEVDAGESFSESFMKTISGGDMITARHLYQGFFEFMPKLKIWFCANDFMRVRAEDGGMWRRLMAIPFMQSIPHKDPTIKRDLLDMEKSGPAILRWLVDGCLAYQCEGLNPPRAVSEANKEYFSEMDSLTGFLDECATVNPLARADVHEVWLSYTHWAREQGIKNPLNQRNLKKRLEAHGFEQKRTAHIRYWQGFKLHDSLRFKITADSALEDMVSKNDEIVELREYRR